MKDEDAKHELRESESGQTGAKQKKDLQRSQPETPWKLIRREWYTTFSRAPARMEELCRCIVKEFSVLRRVLSRVDVLMQHRATGLASLQGSNFVRPCRILAPE